MTDNGGVMGGGEGEKEEEENSDTFGSSVADCHRLLADSNTTEWDRKDVNGRHRSIGRYSCLFAADSIAFIGGRNSLDPFLASPFAGFK